MSTLLRMNIPMRRVFYWKLLEIVFHFSEAEANENCFHSDTQQTQPSEFIISRCKYIKPPGVSYTAVVCCSSSELVIWNTVWPLMGEHLSKKSLRRGKYEGLIPHLWTNLSMKLQKEPYPKAHGFVKRTAYISSALGRWYFWSSLDSCLRSY